MLGEKRKFVAFDIDGTVYRFSLLIELVKELVRMGVFPPDTEKQYRTQFEKWQDRAGSYDDYINCVVKVFLGNIQGIALDTVMNAARNVVAKQSKRTYRYTRTLIEDFKSQGYFLVYVSHSPHPVVGEFSRQFGFDAHQGTLYEVDSAGILTGKLESGNSFNKAAVLSRMVEKYGLDWADSYAVGDTDSDIDMLRMVKNPICFNPNRKLYETAQAEGWPIVVERKDLILTIIGSKVQV